LEAVSAFVPKKLSLSRTGGPPSALRGAQSLVFDVEAASPAAVRSASRSGPLSIPLVRPDVPDRAVRFDHEHRRLRDARVALELLLEDAVRLAHAPVVVREEGELQVLFVREHLMAEHAVGADAEHDYVVHQRRPVRVPE
jgi:hypothetical protein